VVGQAHTDGNASVHAFLYAEGKMHDLNDLVVSGLGTRTAQNAVAINNRGQIVGHACAVFESTCRAFRFDPLAEPQPIVVVPTLSDTAMLATMLLVLAVAFAVRMRG